MTPILKVAQRDKAVETSDVRSRELDEAKQQLEQARQQLQEAQDELASLQAAQLAQAAEPAAPPPAASEQPPPRDEEVLRPSGGRSACATAPARGAGDSAAGRCAARCLTAAGG